MNRIFLVGGVYGLALGVLIASHLLGWGLLDLFLKKPYTLGTHTTVWMDWHSIGCSFVGVTSLLASGAALAGTPRRQAAKALFAIYAIWGVQNAWVCVTRPDFTAVMWLHAILCLACAAGYAAWLRGSPTA